MSHELLARTGEDAPTGAGVPVRQIGQWGLVWRRFRRHRLAVIGGAVLLCMAALALIGPFFSPGFSHPDQTGNIPLSIMQRANQGPQLSWPFLMGTDPVGGPVVSYVLEGGGPILAIGIFGAVLASAIGVALGGLSGHLGGAVDALLMRLVDAFLAVPFLLLLVLLSTYLTDRSVLTYVVLFGLAGWPGVARLVRSYALSLREREYTVAARALGVSSWGIIGRHLLPNALDVIVVSLTLNAAVFMIAEVSLDYLHAGTGATTWGTLLQTVGPLGGYWWQPAFPGLALLLTVLAVNFLGDGLRDALESTSTTALVTVTPGAEEERATGPLRRLLQRFLGTAASSSSRTVEAMREDVAAGRAAAIRWLVPGWVREWARADRGYRYSSAPLVVRVAPLVAAFLAVEVAVLYGHSPLRYAPHYGRPATYADLYGQTEYGAWPAPTAGWDILAVDNRARLAYLQVGPSGEVRRERLLRPGDLSSQPSLAESNGHVLGAWVGDQGQAVWGADLGSAGPAPFRLNPAGGTADHPLVLPAPAGGFDVLFGWQPAQGSAHDIYLARVPPGESAAQPLVRLVRSGGYALSARAAFDGRGRLDVVYLQRMQRDLGVWQVRFQRFTAGGGPLGGARSLGRVTYAEMSPLTGKCSNAQVEPQRWAIDVKRAPDGSVWAAWETGDDCIVPRTGVTGVNTLFAGHWSADGRQLLPPSPVDPGVEASGQAVGLALHGASGTLYYMQPGPVVSYLRGTGFTVQGAAAGSERVSYDAGGNAANPTAATVAGRPAVLWEKVRSGDALLEGTLYHARQPPDLLTRLGLNIGNLWANLALVVFGPIAGAVALSLINLFLLVPLIPVWLAVRRLPASARWPLYLAAIGLLLAWIFAVPPSPPGYVLVLTSLGIPFAWYAVAGAVFVSGWSGRYLLARQESGMRATAMAVIALAFVAAMYTVMFIEGQIGRM